MQVFVVINLSKPTEVAAAIRRSFPDNFIELREGQWLVAANLKTTREIAEQLGISEGENGNGIVVSLDAYWGRAAPSIWEWVTARKSANGG